MTTVDFTGLPLAPFEFTPGPTGGQTVLKFPTDAENVAPFALVLDRTANPVGTRKDNVLRLGFNTSPGGARVDATKHALALELETFYYPFAGKRWTEAHLAFTGENGVIYRPWSLEADVEGSIPGSGKAVRFRLSGDELNFCGPDVNDVRASMNATSFGLKSGYRLDLLGRGPLLTQETVPLIHLTATSAEFVNGRIQLGSGSWPLYAISALYLGQPGNTDAFLKLTINGAGGAANSAIRLHNESTSTGNGATIRSTRAGSGTGDVILGRSGFIMGPTTNLGDFVIDTGTQGNNVLASRTAADVAAQYTRVARFDGWKGHMELHIADAGVILASPNGTRYKIGVSNAGAVTVIAAPY